MAAVAAVVTGRLLLRVLIDFWRALPMVRGLYVMVREGVVSSIIMHSELLQQPRTRKFIVLLAVLRSIESKRSRQKNAPDRISRALQRMGPSWVKLGQFLATRADLVGPKLANDLIHLQDALPPFPKSEAIEQVVKALDAPLSSWFISFGDSVAAASIAQVHQARRAVNTDRDAELVAVKILRPGIRARFRRDMEAILAAARLTEHFLPAMRRLRPVAVAETMAHSVSLEMDLRLEAAAMAEFQSLCGSESDVRIPAIDWERTASNVLTTEWIEGTPLTQPEQLVTRGIPLPEVGEKLLQHFLYHALQLGFFHADMHPGNIFIDVNGRITLVDFGIMGRLTLSERRFLAEILYGFIQRDYKRIARVHFEAGYVPNWQNEAEFARALRAIGEPIHGQRAEEISMARLLALLFEITRLFDMKARPELLLLQKTMVTVEGVARSLHPQLNMWKTCEPVVGAWMREHLGVVGKFSSMRSQFETLQHALGDAPGLARLVSDATRRLATGGNIEPESPSSASNDTRPRSPYHRSPPATGFSPLLLAAFVAALMALILG